MTLAQLNQIAKEKGIDTSKAEIYIMGESIGQVGINNKNNTILLESDNYDYEDPDIQVTEV